MRGTFAKKDTPKSDCARNSHAAMTQGRKSGPSLRGIGTGLARDAPVNRHILQAAATMVGVSVTLVGLVKVSEAHRGASHVDQYAAVLAIVFMVSAVLSYCSMRKSGSLSDTFETVADGVFMLGLIGITIMTTLFAWEFV